MLKCSECNKNLVDDLKWNSWLKIVNFIELLYLEEQITAATYEQMTNCMMFFKKYAMEENE